MIPSENDFNFKTVRLKTNFHPVCSVNRGGGVQYIEGYHEYIGGYHEYIGGYVEYIGGCSIHWGISRFMWGSKLIKPLIYIENPDVLNMMY